MASYMTDDHGTDISLRAPRPLTEDEMVDAQFMLNNILDGRSFFYAADDEIGDEIRKFMIDHNGQVLTNLEQVVED
jgi:hypothetical protein